MSIKDKIRNGFPVAAGVYHFLWAWSAAKLHRSPSQKIFVIGITGTKGKTTTLELLNAILEAAGKKTALLSSLRMKIGAESIKNKTGNSMPGRHYIQSFLNRAVRAGCNYAIIEVTSQGVVQHRHRFINWNIGVLTNLAPEHIESHGSFENYRAAKLSFLQYVAEGGGKIFLNEDDPNFPFFKEALLKMKTTSYIASEQTLSNYLPKRSPLRTSNQTAEGENAKFLLSNFNRSNIACAVSIAKEIGVSDTVIQGAITNFAGVPGRFELVKLDGYTAIVDYAHTPDSLEAAYRAAREQVLGANASVVDNKPRPLDHKLICVLGACGGGRDIWKRPEFGKIAAQYCDEIFLTNEDPYDENSEQVMSQIKSGIPTGQFPAAGIHEISDRHDAIVAAVAMMREGDVVIGTGKGSEDWIHYARGKKIPWSEKAEFEKALAAKKHNAENSTQNGGVEDKNAGDTSPLELPWV